MFFCDLWQVLKGAFVGEQGDITMCIGNSLGCDGLRFLMENRLCGKEAWYLSHDSFHGMEETFKQRQVLWP